MNYQQNNNQGRFNNFLRQSHFAGIDELYELDINGTSHMSINKSTMCKVPGSDLAKFFSSPQNLQMRKTK